MYDKQPYIPVSSSSGECSTGWSAIGETLNNVLIGDRPIVCVECYPGAFVKDISDQLTDSLKPSLLISTERLFLPSTTLDRRIAPMLTEDPVFGVMNGIEIEDYLDWAKVKQAQREICEASKGVVLVIGTGAVRIAPDHDLLVYADLARWEIQQRQRRGEIGNLGTNNLNELASLKYKRAFFFDWRAADRLKQQFLSQIDFVLDTNVPTIPKMISGDASLMNAPSSVAAAKSAAVFISMIR